MSHVEILLAERSPSPTELANALAQFTKKKGRPSDPHLSRLLDVVEAGVSSLASRDLAGLLVSCSRINIARPRLWHALCSAIGAKAAGLDARGIANTLNALAKLDYYDKAVVEKLLVEVLLKAGDFNSQDRTTTLNALAKFDHVDKAVTEKLSAVASIHGNCKR